MKKIGFNTSRVLCTVLSLLLAVLMMLSFAACSESPDVNDIETQNTTTAPKETETTDEYASLWADATYTENVTLGEGDTVFNFDVTAGTRTVTFTINTDEETVGAALLAEGIIAGDMGDFGLYVKTVNGIFADYDVTGTYWAFYENGEYGMNGVDRTIINDGASYAMVYTK